MQFWSWDRREGCQISDYLARFEPCTQVESDSRALYFEFPDTEVIAVPSFQALQGTFRSKRDMGKASSISPARGLIIRQNWTYFQEIGPDFSGDIEAIS